VAELQPREVIVDCFARFIPLCATVITVIQLVLVHLSTKGWAHGRYLVLDHRASLLERLRLLTVSITELLLTHVINLVDFRTEFPFEVGLQVPLQLLVTVDFGVVREDEPYEFGNPIGCLLACLHLRFLFLMTSSKISTCGLYY